MVFDNIFGYLKKQQKISYPYKEETKSMPYYKVAMMKGKENLIIIIIIIINIDMMSMDEQKPVVPKRTIPNILVTGTPGTGKTTLATLLNQALHFTYINIGKLVSEKKLYKEWDTEFNVSIFDEDMVLDYIEENYDINKGGIIIDFHSSDFFPLRYFDLVVLMRCGNQQLFKRLQQRGYGLNKINENLDCQILQVTHDQVYEAYPAQIILELKNQQNSEMQRNLQIVIEWLQNFKETRTLELQLQQQHQQ